MPRKHPSLSTEHPANESKGVQFNVRLTSRQLELLNAGAAHLGQSTSAYVRWLIETGTPQVLGGPSKADKLKAAEDHFHSLMAPIKELPPMSRLRQPGEVVTEPVIVHAPAHIPPPKEAPEGAPLPQSVRIAQDLVAAFREHPSGSERLVGPPKGLGATSGPTQPPTQLPPLHGAPAPTLDELIRSCGVTPGQKGPQPLGLPDDMDDWA